MCALENSHLNLKRFWNRKYKPLNFMLVLGTCTWSGFVVYIEYKVCVSCVLFFQQWNTGTTLGLLAAWLSLIRPPVRRAATTQWSVACVPGTANGGFSVTAPWSTMIQWFRNIYTYIYIACCKSVASSACPESQAPFKKTRPQVGTRKSKA